MSHALHDGALTFALPAASPADAALACFRHPEENGG